MDKSATMATPAFAGHAGETGPPFMMPHELMGAIVLLVLLVIALMVLTVLTIRRLLRLERRVRSVEQRLIPDQRGSSPPNPPN